MGELHLDIIMDRLKREFKVEVNQGAPQVAYKESITGTVQHRETYKKQTGGRGKFADIQVIISPNDEGKEGLQFVNEISAVVQSRVSLFHLLKKALQSFNGKWCIGRLPVNQLKSTFN